MNQFLSRIYWSVHKRKHQEVFLLHTKQKINGRRQSENINYKNPDIEMHRVI